MKPYNEMTLEELNEARIEIASVMNKLNNEADIQNSLKRNIGGFTCKDIAVRWGRPHGEDSEINYSFYLKKDGKEYDFYYGKSDQGAGEWWPKADPKYDDYMSPIFDFVPNGFCEAMENCYEYHGTHEEALDELRKRGITDISEATDW